MTSSLNNDPIQHDIQIQSRTTNTHEKIAMWQAIISAVSHSWFIARQKELVHHIMLPFRIIYDMYIM